MDRLLDSKRGNYDLAHTADSGVLYKFSRLKMTMLFLQQYLKTSNMATLNKPLQNLKASTKTSVREMLNKI